MDNDSDNDTADLLNENVCQVCVGEKDGDFCEWIGCDCGSWYHIGCLDDPSLQAMSMSEIEKLTYVCERCKV